MNDSFASDDTPVTENGTSSASKEEIASPPSVRDSTTSTKDASVESPKQSSSASASFHTAEMPYKTPKPTKPTKSTKPLVAQYVIYEDALKDDDISTYSGGGSGEYAEAPAVRFLEYSAAEDDALMKAVDKHGVKDWTATRNQTGMYRRIFNENNRSSIDLQNRWETYLCKRVAECMREKLGARRERVVWTGEETYYARILVEDHGNKPKTLQQMISRGFYRDIFSVNMRTGKDIADKVRRDNDNPNGGYKVEAAMLEEAVRRKRKRMEGPTKPANSAA